VPSGAFLDLSTWHLIHWQQSPKAVRDAMGLRNNYLQLQLHDRLIKVLRQKLGHGLAHGIEQAKIACSASPDPQGLDLSLVEAGLAAELTSLSMQEHLQALMSQVVDCGLACVQAAGLTAEDIGALYLTGGSSALPSFQSALRNAFPGVELVSGDLFGGVASGLAYGA
jgi:hypothetical chaperone protein